MSMKERWKYNNTCVYNCGYHLIWCSKYRRKVLIDGVDARLKDLLMEKAKDINIDIEQMEVMPDHVHLFVHAKPNNPAHHIIGQFKGYTSRILRKEFHWLTTKLPTLWTRSYYAETVGHISQLTIENYIKNQKTKQD